MRGSFPDFLRRALLALALIAVLLLATNAGAILARRFPDPDDALRLQEVRDLIAGQGWFDLHQYRIDPGDGGVAMHWSRIVDVPIAAVILLLRPLFGPAAAELAAMVIVPLLTLAAAVLLVARVAWERLGRDYTVLACLMLAMSVPVMTQIRPMRIDHHGWQVVAALLAMNGLMTRHARAGGWITGLAMAIGLSISLEGLPLAVVFAGIGAWRWLRGWQMGGGHTKLWLAHYLAALAAGSLACFAVTRGVADLAVHCDAMSPVHLAMLVWGAVAFGALARWRGAPLPVVLAGFAVAGVGALALYLGIAPQCRGGSFEMLDPLVRSQWYDQVAEGMPIWRQDWATALQTAVPPLFALWACVRLIAERGSDADERIWWQEYTALLAGALVIALLVTRAGAVTGALAAVPLAWQVRRWLAGLRGRWWGAAGIALALVPAAPITVWQMFPHPVAPGAKTVPVAAGRPVSACHIAAAAGTLAALPRGQILAPLDMGPELLLSSADTVLATGHHRGARAMHDVIAAFLAPQAQAHAILRRRAIAYVALCPMQAEAMLYARAAPQGLAAQLLRGQAPAWLRPVPAAQGLSIWQVVG